MEHFEPCEPRYEDGRQFVCAAVATEGRQPRDRAADGCPGGMMACGRCTHILVSFLHEAYNARAIREEHSEEKA
jgi:hypothetical protein